LLLAAPLRAEPLVIDPPTMRILAFEAVQAGFAEDALEITDALLARDPNDASALTIRSQALRALGRYPEAIEAARAAWKAADTQPARFGAAMAMAAAQSSSGRRTRAELWLRRAANVAPNERTYAIAQRDFGYVQSRNPWRFVFDLTAAPSSNVNNGSSADAFALPGIPVFFEIAPENQALSGAQLGFGVEVTYRFNPTGPNRQTALTFGTSVQAATLSSSARRSAPLADASDYTLSTVETGLTHRRGFGPDGTTILNLSGTLGHNWYGGADLSNYVELGAQITRPITPRVAVTFGLSADDITRLDRPLQSSTKTEVTAGLQFALGPNNADRLSLRLASTDVASDSVEVRNHATSLAISWEKGAPIAGIGIAASLTVEDRRFPNSRYVAGGRDDLRLTGKIGLTFTQIDYLGFSPVLEIQASRNQSNSALHDSQALGINLGIASTF
jgi:hypothetical protein